MELREVTYLAVALRIVVAVILGGILGLERGLKHRPAGLRTYMLVCVGSCLIMLTNQYIYQITSVGDPVRMGAQVVSGIGFLGAGTIIVTRRNQIKGLTTAAGLWSAAGVGLALGIGFYEAAVAGAFAVFFVMTMLQRMDNRMHRMSRQVELYFELSDKMTLGDFLREVRDRGYTISEIQRENQSDREDRRAYVAILRSPQRRHHMDIMEQIQGIKGLICLEEL